MKTLSLSKTSGIYRWFEKNLDVWLRFTSSTHRRAFFAKGDNLCHFVRTCTLYPLTVAVCHLLAAWWAWKCFVGYPTEWYGAKSYVVTIGEVVGVLVAVVSVIIGFVYCVELVGEKLGKRRVSSPKPESNLRRIAEAWTDSKLHEAVCPQIDFEEKK